MASQLKMNLVQRIVGSKKFVKTLSQARREHERTHLETGFGVGVFYDEPGFRISSVDISYRNDSMRGPGAGDSYQTGAFGFMHVHFHGDFETSYPPSRQDIENFNTNRIDLYLRDGILVAPVMGVASYDRRKKMTLVLLQEKTPGPIGAIAISDFCDEYDTLIDQFEEEFIVPHIVGEFFEKSGLYRCAILSATTKKVRNIKVLGNFSDSWEFRPEQLKRAMQLDFDNPEFD